jgi:hypothetical protein
MLACLSACLNAQWMTGLQNVCNFEKGMAAKILYFKWRVVTFKKHFIVKMVARQ